MLGSVLGKLYRGVIGKLFGIDTIVREQVSKTIGADLPAIIRAEIDQGLRTFLNNGERSRATMDVEQAAYFMASVTSAQYFLDWMRMAPNLVRAHDLIRHVMRLCTVEGLILEFGVFQGSSLAVIAEETDQPVYGFDSFQGLPEDWTHHQRKGRFSLEGKLPKLEAPNVRLIPGWFEETLPAFLRQHAGAARFVHVDSDLYSSAVTVLGALRERIVPGTVIVLDEYFNYPGWEHHEFKAFKEFIHDTGLSYEYIGIASAQQAVAVRIT